MVAVDTNVLVYAHRREVRGHGVARAILRDLSEGAVPWAIPWPCCYEFLAIVTNRKIWGSAATPPELAWHQVLQWAASPSSQLAGETSDFLETLEGFINRPRVRGGVVHDALIAAICRAHGIDVLPTRDRDFSLFPELATRDPFR